MTLQMYLLLNVPACFIQVFFLNLMLKAKFNKTLTFFGLFIPFTFFASLKQIVPKINGSVPMLFIISYTAIYVLVMFKDKIKTRVFNIMMSFAIYFTVDFLTLAIYAMLGGDIYNPNMSFVIFFNLVLTFGYFIFFIASKKTLFGIENNRFTVFGMSLLTIMQVTLAVMMEALFFSKYVFGDKYVFGFSINSKNFFYLIFLSVGIIILLTDVVMIYVMSKASKSVAMQKDLELYEYKQSLYADYYAEVEANSQQTRKIRHDMANITEAIGAMLQSNNASDNEVARELYEKLQADVQNIHSYVYCSDNLLNAILTIKANICRNNGIEPDFTVATDDFSKLDKTDLCKTVTNLLDNAIKSTAEANEEKKIVFRIAADDNSLFISTVNPIGVNQPTPDDEKAHGYGLKILEDVAKKNKGEFITEEKDGMFTAQMII